MKQFSYLCGKISEIIMPNERQRLQQLMESEKVNAKEFAARAGISQSTLSNILGGRNKPSLDVIQAVLNAFRTISADWLVLGIGPMYRPQGANIQSALFDVKPNIKEEEKPVETSLPAIHTPAKSVTKLTIFYSDGTFEDR